MGVALRLVKRNQKTFQRGGIRHTFQPVNNLTILLNNQSRNNTDGILARKIPLLIHINQLDIDFVTELLGKTVNNRTLNSAR